jgi:thioredoxin-like negative regulator of GroEL
MSKPQEELRQLLAGGGPPVVLLLAENFHPAAAALAEELRRQVLARPGGWRLVELDFHAYREWAHDHGIPGFPAVALWRAGHQRAVLLGCPNAGEIGALLDSISS